MPELFSHAIYVSRYRILSYCEKKFNHFHSSSVTNRPYKLSLYVEGNLRDLALIPSRTIRLKIEWKKSRPYGKDEYENFYGNFVINTLLSTACLRISARVD